MAKRKGQVVLSTLVTQDTEIRIPIVDSNDVGGGRMYVETIEERNAIPVKLRKVGMVVRVSADSTDYELLAGFGANDATISNDFWKVYAPGLPEGVLTEHQKVEDIEYADPTEAGYETLTEKLAAMDQATENADKDVEEIVWATAPVGTGRNQNLSSELNYLFSALEDPTKIVLDTTTGTSLSTKLGSVDGEISTINSTLSELTSMTSIEPNVTVFEIADNVKEVGVTVSSITVNWVLNKVVTSAVLKVDGTQIADLANNGKVNVVGSKTINGLNITTDTVIVLEITDSAAAVATKTAKISFKNRLLYGAIDETTTSLTQSLMDGLTKSDLLESPYNKYVRVDCGSTGDKVPVIAVPASLGVDETQLVFLNGYTNSWSKSTISYTNASGGAVQYDVFVFDDALVDKVVMTIVELL